MRLAMLLGMWRDRNGLTLKAAAAIVGIHPSTFARIERGEQMHGATLATILTWLMGREEKLNEAFAFEAEDADASESAAQPELERIPFTFGAEGTGPGESSSNTCELGNAEGSYPEAETNETAGAEIEDEQTPAAEYSLHAVDQDASLCSMRSDGVGGVSHGAAGIGQESAG